jgi:hypothetical protein
MKKGTCCKLDEDKGPKGEIGINYNLPKSEAPCTSQN